MSKENEIRSRFTPTMLTKEMGRHPAYFYLDRNGDLCLFPKAVKEGGKGPFDLVMNFGHSRDNDRTPVRWEQRITGNKREDLLFLAFERPEVAASMQRITLIANNPRRTYEDSRHREEYRSCLAEVYRALAGEVKKRIGQEKALVLPPKNGGIFVAEVYQKLGFPKEDFFDYRASRILLDEQLSMAGLYLLVGIKKGIDNPRITDYQTFVIADDCLASDVSAWTTMGIIRQEFNRQGLPLSGIKVIIAVSAATQKGFERLTSKETRDYFGFKSIKAIGGIPVYQMTENFYLQHPDGRYVVGDMGQWTLPV